MTHGRIRSSSCGIPPRSRIRPGGDGAACPGDSREPSTAGDVKLTIPFLFCGVVASPASYADTEAIELTCDLEVITQPPAGDSKRSHETAVVELLFDAGTGFKAIRIRSVAIPVAVANKKGGAV